MGQTKDSNKKNSRHMFYRGKLPSSVAKGQSDERTFPEDPLERCNLRWKCLFWGIWRCLSQNDKPYRRIKLGIIEAMKKFGLFGVKTFRSELFELNPSDEMLRRAIAYNESPWIDDVRGKKLPWERYDPLTALFDYSSTLFILRKLPQRFRNINNRIVAIKERLPEILKKISYREKDDVPEELLSKWIKLKLSNRELTARLVAYIHGLTHDAFRKHLATARKEHPKWAEYWRRNGVDMIKSK